MEQHCCPVCGTVFDTNAILLHKQLRDTLEKTTVTGYSLCPEHKKLTDEGYLHLVVAEGPQSKEALKVTEAVYSGTIISLKRHVAAEVFNITIPDDTPMVYITQEVADALKNMMEK